MSITIDRNEDIDYITDEFTALLRLLGVIDLDLEWSIWKDLMEYWDNYEENSYN